MIMGHNWEMQKNRELWEIAESFRTHPFLWLYMRLTLSHSEFSCVRASDICAISCLEASRITSGWRSLITSTCSPNRSKLSFILYKQRHRKVNTTENTHCSAQCCLYIRLLMNRKLLWSTVQLDNFISRL